jgi:hypothetical protein
VFSHLTAHGHGTAAATATIVVVALVFHGPEILGEKFGQASILFSQASVANDITGVLYSGRLLDFLFQFYSAITDIVMKELH